ncbi:hypothetical protein BD410DRAFT_760374 [Rickenella mellea]|uniref:Nucleosome assembly protein n=1 Tax=Rickenella mellea TaxID=50990 RepID=A0A4Y7QNY4_9AGAM|nr:hypothetical protein BD410DRAFT_760374 [Rickenella mellea]
MVGKKRGSPGADEEKNPFDVEIGPEIMDKLNAVKADISRVELALERHAQKKLVPAYEKRRTVVKTVPKFWPVALLNNPTIGMTVQHADDQKALAYLEDIWVIRDDAEPRTFIIEFHFSENPYFKDSVLKKVYKYIPPPSAKDDVADENGITQSMIDFEWERDVEPQATKIQWKDDSKNLTKLHPLVLEDGDVSDLGSFFNFFETAKDEADIGIIIANEIYPEAIDWFTGVAGAGELDSDEDDEDEDDDEADEIDLEKPQPKKQKKA